MKAKDKYYTPTIEALRKGILDDKPEIKGKIIGDFKILNRKFNWFNWFKK